MADQLPSIFGNYNAEDDFKDMRQSDKIVPRLRLAAYNNKVVKEKLVGAGAWYNAATNETIFSPDKAGLIIPVIYWNEWIEWNPIKDVPKDKMILRRSADPTSEIAKIAERFEKINTPKGPKFRVTEYYTFLVLVPEVTGNYDDLMLLNFSRSSHKIGKAWLNRMRGLTTKNADGTFSKVPMACGAWELGRTVQAKDGEDYFVPQIGKGQVVDAAVVPLTLAVSAACKARKQGLIDKNTSANDDSERANDAGEVEVTDSEL